MTFLLTLLIATAMVMLMWLGLWKLIELCMALWQRVKSRRVEPLKPVETPTFSPKRARPF